MESLCELACPERSRRAYPEIVSQRKGSYVLNNNIHAFDGLKLIARNLITSKRKNGVYNPELWEGYACYIEAVGFDRVLGIEISTSRLRSVTTSDSPVLNPWRNVWLVFEAYKSFN